MRALVVLSMLLVSRSAFACPARNDASSEVVAVLCFVPLALALAVGWLLLVQDQARRSRCRANIVVDNRLVRALARRQRAHAMIWLVACGAALYLVDKHAMVDRDATVFFLVVLGGLLVTLASAFRIHGVLRVSERSEVGATYDGSGFLHVHGRAAQNVEGWLLVHPRHLERVAQEAMPAAKVRAKL